MKLFIQLIIATVLLFSCKNENIYYVAPDGNDTNPGSMEQPFATIGRAQQAVDQTSGMVTVYLRKGVYYLDKPVVFKPSEKRTKNAMVSYKSYSGEPVKVSGAAKIEGLQWKPYKNGILKTTVPGNLLFDQLFVNGTLQHMARYPNFDPLASHYNGTAADAIDPARVKNWTNPVGGFVHALHKHEWGGYHWEITGKNDKNEVQLNGGYQNNRLMGMHNKHRFVENIFEELDAPGEWFYDKGQKILYFYPPAGMDMSSAVAETPQIKHLFEFKGTEKQPVQFVTIEGIELAHTLRTFVDTREQLLRSDWAIYRGGAILMEGATDCSVKNCFFNAVGGNAVFFSNYNRRNEVSGCHIAHAGASGVCFVGDPKAVRSPSFEYNEYTPLNLIDRTPGPQTNNYPAECIVKDNLMYSLGRVEKQIAGIQVSMSQDITMSHNTIYDLPRSGINISEGTWGGHILEYNDIFNTVLETGDHGSFNSWGRDRYWHPNYDSLKNRTANHSELILLDATKTTVICNNRFRCDHGWDIDLDDGSSNYHIYNNLCLNGGIKLREGFQRTVENNIMINNSFHPHVWFVNSGDVFKHNIVSSSYFPIMLLDWGKEIDYNAFPDEASLKKAQANGTDTHSAFGDFQFVDPEQGNFQVKESSVALKVGFKNFSMDQFGVQSSHLKDIAKKVPIPKLITLSQGDTEVSELMGMKLKNITTQGERSAAGISDISGVWVLEVPESSPAHGFIKPNDIILRFNNNKIANMRDLLNIYKDSGKQVSITVFRNQNEIQLKVDL